MNTPETTQVKRLDSMAASPSPETVTHCHSLLHPPQLATIEGERLHRK